MSKILLWCGWVTYLPVASSAVLFMFIVYTIRTTKLRSFKQQFWLLDIVKCQLVRFCYLEIWCCFARLAFRENCNQITVEFCLFLMLKDEIAFSLFSRFLPIERVFWLQLTLIYDFSLQFPFISPFPNWNLINFSFLFLLSWNLSTFFFISKV